MRQRVEEARPNLALRVCAQLGNSPASRRKVAAARRLLVGEFMPESFPAWMG